MASLGPAAGPPATAGDDPVGVTTITVDDAARERELKVEVWYPAAERSTAAPEVYRVRAVGATAARLRSALGAHRNVEPQAGRHPVVLLSHGAGSSRFANVSLSEVLASHGYVVAAPDHDGHTMGDKIWGIDNEERAQSALDRPIDLSRVLDALVSRSRSSTSLLRGLVDPARVAVAGHSFGGAAALGMVGARFDTQRQARECASDPDDRRCAAVPIFGPSPYRYRDPRIKAALLINPAGYDLYRADGIAQVDAPALVVGAELDQTNPFAAYPKPIYDALESAHYLLYLKTAGHLTATDVCQMIDSIGFLAKTFGGADARDGCGEGYESSRDALERVTRASLPFLDLYLNGNRAAEKALALALGETPPSSTVAELGLAGSTTSKARNTGQ